MPREVTSTASAVNGSPLPRPVVKVGACVVIAEFEVKPDAFGDFTALARRFADECLDSEPGCCQFEVVLLESTPPRCAFL